MLVKRIVLFLISIAIGGGLTTGIVFAVGTTPAEYGFVYFFFTTLCLGVVAGIWLDKFMETELLPK